MVRFDSREEIPEALREGATENDDGTFSVDWAAAQKAGWAIENVSGLKSAKERQQAEAERLRAQHAQERKDLETKLGGKSLDDVLRERDSTKSESQLMRERLQALEERDQKRDADARKERYRAELTTAIAERKGEVGVLLPYLEAQTMMTEDGRVVSRERPELGLSDYVESLSKDPVVGRNFDGNNRGGIGEQRGKPTRQTGPKPNEYSKEELASGRVDPQAILDGKAVVRPSE